ncbi:MAG TPA: UbiA family prenyltransferase, partial [Vicinamibacteria bacterium]|nr:UbiA family prenyltransferase [Vicinamibacteria bacterium]
MSLPRALLVSLRPHQWTKNLVVLAALAFSKHLFDPDAALRAAAALAAFCALSGAVYVVNDLADAERDRLHPLKRKRPIASGALGIATARAFAGLLLLGGLAVAWRLGGGFLICVLGYLVLNLAYTFGLKDVVILDVLAIAIGF